MDKQSYEKKTPHISTLNHVLGVYSSSDPVLKVSQGAFQFWEGLAVRF